MPSGKGTSLTDLRTLNSSTVFDAIRLKAPISRAQLSREVGLTRPTISSALLTLKQAGLIRESPPIPDRPHYGATYFEMVPEAAYFVAVEVEGTRVRTVLGNGKGRRLAARDSARTVSGPKDLLSHIVEVTNELCADAGVAFSRIVMLVVSVPGSVQPGSGRLRSPRLPVLDGYPLGPTLCQAVHKPVVVDSDINLATIGEQAHGAAQQVRDFAYFSVGTRVGIGIFLDGQLWRGAHGRAGQLEEYGPSLSPAAFERLAEQIIHGRRVGFGTSPAAVFDATLRGDAIARRISSDWAGRIADAVAGLGRVLDLELVVLGGSIGRHCHPILNRLQELVADRVAYPPRLAVSALPTGAARTGACTIGARESMNLVTPHLLAQALRADRISDPLA